MKRFLTSAVAIGLLVGSPTEDVSAQSRLTTAEASSEQKPGRPWIDTVDWRCVGPANMGGRIVALAINEKDPSTYWVATASGGLLKTTNNGITFEHQFDQETTVAIGDVDICQSNPDIVWVGTGENNPRNSVSYGDGVYKSTDGGKTWKNMGLKESFQIGAIRVHPENPDIVYVGALGRLYGPNEERGLFKTEDGGETWEKILYVDEWTGVIEVELHPEDPSTLLVATYERQRDGFDTNDPAKKFGDGAGIYRTKDGGKTFEKLDKGLPSVKMGRIGFDYFRSNPDVIFAIIETELIATFPKDAGYAGLQAEDAETGARVTAVTKESPAEEAGFKEGDIILSMNDQTILSYRKFLENVYTSKVGDKMKVEVARSGESVTLDLTLGERPKPEEGEGRRRRGRRSRSGISLSSGLGGQRANLQNLQGEEGHNYGGIYKSEDGGTSWTRINSLNPRPMYYSHIKVDPSDQNNIYVCGTSFHRSFDGGVTFDSNGLNGNVHVDNHALWIDPKDGRHMILGNDGGVYVSYDRTENWDHYNHMAIGQFYHVGVGPRRNYWVYGGLQDNGSWGAPHRTPHRSGPVNQDWLSIGGGDGFIVLVDPNDPHQLYYESQNGATSASNLQTGQRWSTRGRGPRGERNNYNWKTPFILSNHNSRIYYNAGSYVFRSLDRGRDMKRISDNITRTERGSATALSESPLNADVLYVGTDDGALWMTDNGGHDWVSLANFDTPNIDAEAEGENITGSQTASSEEPAERQRGPAPDPVQDDEGEAKETKADPLSGEWLAEFEGEGIPGGGEFSIVLALGDDGKLKGTVHSEMGDSEIIESKWDGESGKLNFTTESENGEADFEVTIKNETMSGQLVVFGGQFTLDFTAKRIKKAGDSKGEESSTELSNELFDDGTETADTEEGEGDGSLPLNELIPGPRWVATLEASKFEEGRVYAALDAHRSDDDNPYVLVSENFGKTWTNISANLPRGSTRCLREDLENENILYVGTEFGAYVSLNRGQTWTKFKGGFPTVAVHEIAQHQSAGDIIAGTHGRSLWIADVSQIRQMTVETLQKDAHLYKPNAVVQWRSKPRRGNAGDRRFVGSNPPTGAKIVYHLGKKANAVSLEVQDQSGKVLRRFEPSNEKGFHSFRWDLRIQSPDQERSQRPQGGRRFRRGGRSAGPGTYKVAMVVDGQTFTQDFKVESDPEAPQGSFISEEELEDQREKEIDDHEERIDH